MNGTSGSCIDIPYKNWTTHIITFNQYCKIDDFLLDFHTSDKLVKLPIKIYSNKAVGYFAKLEKMLESVQSPTRLFAENSLL